MPELDATATIEKLTKRVAFLEGELLFIAGRAGLAASYDDDFHATGVLLEIRDQAKAAATDGAV